MTELTKTRLQELAIGKAELADRMFYEFEEAVRNAAVAAELLYADADAYPPRDVPLPLYLQIRIVQCNRIAKSVGTAGETNS